MLCRYHLRKVIVVGSFRLDYQPLLERAAENEPNFFLIQQDDSIKELIASVSGLSSNDNTPQKPRLPAVKRPKEDTQGSPAKQKLFDEEYIIILLLM